MEQNIQVLIAPAEDSFAISALPLVFIDRIFAQKYVDHFPWKKHRKSWIFFFLIIERKYTK